MYRFPCKLCWHFGLGTEGCTEDCEALFVKRPGRRTGGRMTPPLKWHGGKHYLAAKIVDLMPSHIHYVEPYFGGGAVLLAKNPKALAKLSMTLTAT
jgi:hypothetical protein